VLGIRASALIFCTLIFLGQLVFAVGVQMREYWMCLLGRFIFGLGGENLAVSQVHIHIYARE
jgi:nitrate/nitrite transporter NarK